MYRKSILMLIFTLLFSMSVMVVSVPEQATAAGVTVYADLNADPNYNGGGVITPGDPASLGAWPNIADGGSAEVFFSFQALQEFDSASNDVLKFTVPSGWSVATTCATAGNTTDSDGDTSDDGDWTTVVGQVATFEFDGTTSSAATNGIEVCLTLTAPADQADEMEAVYMQAASTNNETGAALIYGGDENDVNVYASVGVTLTFEIRNGADSAHTNECDLGLLAEDDVATCDYRLKVTTNASDGYTVKLSTDGDLRSSGSGDVSDSSDIDLITDESNPITNASPEAYGVALNAGSCTFDGGTATELGDYAVNDTALPVDPTAAAEDVYSCAGANNPSGTDTTNTALMEHRAKSDADTSAGDYSQTVSYFVIADF